MDKTNKYQIFKEILTLSNFNELIKIQIKLSRDLTKYRTQLTESVKVAKSFNHSDYVEFAKIQTKWVENLNSNLPNLDHLQNFQTAVDDLNKTIKTSLQTLTFPYSSDYLTKTSVLLHELCQTICTEIKIPTISPECFDFLKNVDFKNESIELTKNDYDSINTILEASISNNPPLEAPKKKITKIEFISLIISILGILLSLLSFLQTKYYHELDNIESQKAHIEELQLKEEELHLMKQQLQNEEEQKETLEKILIELQNLSENYKSYQEASEYLCESHKSLDQVPKPLSEVPYSADGTQDNALSSPDAPKNLEVDIYKE